MGVNDQPTVGKVEFKSYYPTYPIYPLRNTPVYQLQPHRCPICGGSTIVPAGFYNRTGNSWSSTNTTEQCRSCKGQGIIWG